ncbi:CBN-SRZ-45 protein [Caenorhabditis brenneri]|uniref:CBN-SRZ-45 protein n=1 Tax=Caenorhabditis brenneri TaxID=135651 RepID=G0PF68_CAEBE|nr:CBN-SRZ-45 protein [Caenorhabditis brenneri]
MIQLCFLFLPAVLFLVFPFFVVVYRGNKERDRNTSVYPILHHFYKAICFFYISIGISLVIITASVIFGSNEDISFRIVTPLTQCLIFFPMVIFNHAHHFVIFLLSLQRVYFFFSSPTDGMNSSLEKSTTKSFLKWIYVILFFLHIVFFFWVALCKSNREMQYQAYELYYALLNFLTLLSALLYIPILVKIRKFAHLPSYNLSNPQKYILCQTVLIALSKMAHLWALLNFFSSNSIVQFFVLCLIFDVLSTPILIQVSYLLCNKRNVEALSQEWSQHITTVVKNALTCRTVKVAPAHKEETTTA